MDDLEQSHPLPEAMVKTNSTSSLKNDLVSLRAARDNAAQAAQDAVFNTTRLTRLLSILSESIPIQSLLNQLLVTLSELFLADIVILLDPVGTGSYVPLASLGLPEGLASDRFFEGKEGYTVRVMESRSPIMIGDVQNDPKCEPFLRAQGVETLVWVPVIGNNISRGAILLARSQTSPFSKTDAEQLMIMASRIGLTLDQSQHSLQVEHVEQFSRSISRHLDINSICDEVVCSFHPILGADASVLALINADNDLYSTVQNGIDFVPLSDWQNLCQQIIKERPFTNHESFYISPHELQKLGMDQEKIKTLLVAPIFTGESLMGLLFAIRFSEIPFTPDAKKIVHLFAGQTSTALENATLFQTVRQELIKREKAEEALEYLAFHDELTRLVNRTFFTKRLQEALSRANANSKSVALMFLDLDNFKIINDSLGHEIGDEVLIIAAKRISTCLRGSDLSARFGGDEFTILVEDADSAEQIISIAQRILLAFQNPIVIDNRELYANCSIGIAISVPNEDTPENLMRKADLSMYKAKDKGKGCFAVFDSDMNREALSRLELETELRSALLRNEFRVYYQPIISLESHRIVEIEALIRWEHPTRGLLYPDEIIPLAEETGLIIDIGQWVLKEACDQVQTWNQKYFSPNSISLSLNLSAKQLLWSDLETNIDKVIQKSKIDPCTLIFEMTENNLILDSETTITKIQALKQKGVRLAIDDFGIGYAS